MTIADVLRQCHIQELLDEISKHCTLVNGDGIDDTGKIAIHPRPAKLTSSGQFIEGFTDGYPAIWVRSANYEYGRWVSLKNHKY